MITHLLFDLDNTLYPEHSPIDNDIRRRMIDFTAGITGTDRDTAAAMRIDALKRHGTTLSWLQHEYNLRDIDIFFSAVHPPCETDGLIPDTELRPLLQSLSMPMAILTNAPAEHAERVLDFFNVADLFAGKVFDIRFAQLQGKPHAAAFANALNAAGFPLKTTLFLDDNPHYVDGYAALGGETVLVDEFDKYSDKPYNRIHSLHELPPMIQKLNTIRSSTCRR